jgi:excisionase family DNA binding protein
VPDELLTVAEVAELLKLNQQTVRNMIDRGELRAVRVGQRRVRIRQSQLDAFLTAGEMTPEAEPAVAHEADEDRWLRVRDAASAVAIAAEAEDRDGLDQAISALTSAAQGL